VSTRPGRLTLLLAPCLRYLSFRSSFDVLRPSHIHADTPQQIKASSARTNITAWNPRRSGASTRKTLDNKYQPANPNTAMSTGNAHEGNLESPPLVISRA
jgi:hypothetical protein